jgi:muramoyltetrapeptide carboxypeptidase
MVPLTLRTGMATLHGSDLMDTPCAVPEPLLPWLAAATAPAGGVLRQSAARAYRSGRHDHYALHPQVREMPLNTPGRWTDDWRLCGDGVDAARLALRRCC